MEGMLGSRAQVLKGNHKGFQFIWDTLQSIRKLTLDGVGGQDQRWESGIWPGVPQMKDPTNETLGWKEVHDQLVCVSGRVKSCQAQWEWDGFYCH